MVPPHASMGPRLGRVEYHQVGNRNVMTSTPRFNGATLRTRGILGFAITAALTGDSASMGPRLGRVEYQRLAEVADPDRVASMGPRLGRVEYLLLLGDIMLHYCVLQWGHA